jgi:V-type H+-transporting ATPase subunit H
MELNTKPADISELFQWILKLINSSNDIVVDILIQYLQSILQIHSYRILFLSVPNGLNTILNLLKKQSTNSQMHYQLISCVWLLSFVPQGAADFSRYVLFCSKIRVYQVIPVLKDILKTAIKEKVIRVIIATFKVFFLLKLEYDFESSK